MAPVPAVARRSRAPIALVALGALCARGWLGAFSAPVGLSRKQQKSSLHTRGNLKETLEVALPEPEEPAPEQEPLPDRRVPYSLHVVSHLPHNKHLKEESNARRVIEQKIAHAFANSEDIIKHVEVNLQVSENFHKHDKISKGSKNAGVDDDIAAMTDSVHSTVAPYVFKVTVTLKNKRTVVLANPEKHAQATLKEGLDHMVDVIKRALRQEKERTIEFNRRQNEQGFESGPDFSQDLEGMEADSLAAEEQAAADAEAEDMYSRIEAASTK